jgi:hypothetical protein
MRLETKQSIAYLAIWVFLTACVLLIMGCVTREIVSQTQVLEKQTIIIYPADKIPDPLGPSLL